MKTKFDECVARGFETYVPDGFDSTTSDESLERGADADPDVEEEPQAEETKSNEARKLKVVSSRKR